MTSPTQYFENAAAQEIFEFQVCHVNVKGPARELSISVVILGLEYGKHGVKGVCERVEQCHAPSGTLAPPLTPADGFLTPVLHRIDKDGLRRFVERSSGSNLLRDICRCQPPKNSTSTLHRWRCLSVSDEYFSPLFFQSSEALGPFEGDTSSPSI